MSIPHTFSDSDGNLPPHLSVTPVPPTTASTQTPASVVYGPDIPTTVIPPTSKATTSNPKDLLGSKKPSLSKIPAVALLWESLAMMDGGGKYGPYNWRDKAVVASIYVDACKRHLDAWFEGQKTASDSGCHHLGHARACLGILLDAEATGNLVDDRPVKQGTPEAYQKALDEVVAAIGPMQERHKAFHEAAAKSAAATA